MSVGTIDCQTHSSPETLALEWKITDFTSLLQNERYSCRSFTFGGESWHLSVKHNLEDYVEIFIEEESSAVPVSLDISTSFKTSRGEKACEVHCEYTFEGKESQQRCILSILRPNLLQRRSELLPFDILTIACVLKLVKPSKNEIIREGTVSAEVPGSQAASTGCSFNITPHMPPFLPPDSGVSTLKSPPVTLSSGKGFITAVQTGTTIKFNPPTGTDKIMKRGVWINIRIAYQCITCMKEYENKSFEELRVEDYAANRKGGTAGGIIFKKAAQARELSGLTPVTSSPVFSFSTTQSKPFFGILGTTFNREETSSAATSGSQAASVGSNLGITPPLPPFQTLASKVSSFETLPKTFAPHWNINCGKKDKSVQTPSYIDNCFLVEGVSRDFSKLLDEGVNHDVEFVCGDRIIRAHKNILSCRSKVFSSMFHRDMAEGDTGKIIIENMDAITFEQFLRCLYTGILPKLTLHNAVRLYHAGHKYDIGALKKQCADFLTDILSPENACDILIFSDQHSDPDFKKSVIRYIVQKKIQLTGGKWIDYCKRNPVLATEILNSFYQYHNE